MTALGPCAWFATFDDNTGICTGCAPALQPIWAPEQTRQLRTEVAAIGGVR